MDEKNKKFLLNLAKKAIESKIKDVELNVGDVPKELQEIGCCFITLNKDNNLRGCIGHLEAFEPLYQSVIHNALGAAFEDPRFPALSAEELKDVKIEISVLSPSKKVSFSSEEDLLNKLSSKEGVILKKGDFHSTFLPQVWEDLPDKKEFLENLSMKAGLPPDAWKSADIFVYSVLKFEE